MVECLYPAQHPDGAGEPFLRVQAPAVATPRRVEVHQVHLVWSVHCGGEVVAVRHQQLCTRSRSLLKGIFVNRLFYDPFERQPLAVR